MDWYKMHLEQLKAEDRDTWISFSAKDDEKPTCKIAKWHDAANRLISISTLPLCCPTSRSVRPATFGAVRWDKGGAGFRRFKKISFDLTDSIVELPLIDHDVPRMITCRSRCVVF
jgi:hypothetical protein